jgi:3-deoxy-manno-octulosonate cytidylyltransferase (CMP-KDO synthetase)
LSHDSGFYVVIPARYAATRLPGKPLQDIGGRPMLAHVYQRAQDSGATQVIIATDDARIENALSATGAEVWLTSAAHQSGSDRLAEVVTRAPWADDSIVVNVQGDEPLIPPALIRQVADALHQHPAAHMASLCETFSDETTLMNPNVVKVVRDKDGYALYFSRAPIPWMRDGFAANLPLHYRHIGLYAYRVGFLKQFAQLPAAPLEQLEALEQLRALYHGARIYMAEACEKTAPGVDTPEDLAAIRGLFANVD